MSKDFVSHGPRYVDKHHLVSSAVFLFNQFHSIAMDETFIVDRVTNTSGHAKDYTSVSVVRCVEVDMVQSLHL